MKWIYLLCISFLSFSCSPQYQKKIISTSNAPKAIGPYSQGVISNNIVYVSGQIGVNDQGKLVEGIENQTFQTLKNVDNILKSQGLNAYHVTRTTIYLTDLKNYSIVNKIYEDYFREQFPARLTVEVSKLPLNALVEISCIAHQ